ncbi:MAG: DUF4920 domain-containing protein [Candidatus Aminicenantes bacterium]|nr:DUF4920 domain-containing protein [Candidatus Aminicenantes bacterium]
MRVLAWIGLLFAAVAAPAAKGEQYPHLGEPFAAATATPVAEVLAYPERFANRVVRLTGRIASVCNEEGCFIEVVPPDGGGDGIVVNFPGLKFTFPKDCAGLTADVEGLLYGKVYHRARVAHWQHHSFRPGIAIPPFSSVWRLEARAAHLSGLRAAIPAPSELRAAIPDKINLTETAFEDEGFGVDRRVVEAGATLLQPAAATVRKIVVCVEGLAMVERAGTALVSLSPGEMTYIPAAAAFNIRAGKSVAAVLIVYANAPQPSGPSH